MKIFFLIILIITALPLFAQKDRAEVDMELQPYTMSGHSLLKRNLHFAGYKTQKFRRNIASWFSFGTFNIGNKLLTVHGVPLYRKYKTRSVDIFSFALKTDSGIVSRTACRAKFRKNETFSLFKPKDSSYFKIKNVDHLEARIRMDSDPAHVWYLTAANLNGSYDAEQQGVIRCGDKEIRFVKTTCVLRDEVVIWKDMKSLFTSPNVVYLFTYNGENIAAVSFRLKDRMFWCRDDLDGTIKTVVASAASLLCLRKELYY